MNNNIRLIAIGLVAASAADHVTEIFAHRFDNVTDSHRGIILVVYVVREFT
jgi:hypothetical protein